MRSAQANQPTSLVLVAHLPPSYPELASHTTMAATQKLVLLGAVAGALIVAAPTSAGSDRVGTGTGTLGVRSSTIVRQAYDYRIERRTIRGSFSGALRGSFVERVRGVVRASGVVTFQGTMTFTGRVAGCGSGRFEVGLSGQGRAGGEPNHERDRTRDRRGRTRAPWLRNGPLGGRGVDLQDPVPVPVIALAATAVGAPIG
jgi:hypothetical protein